MSNFELTPRTHGGCVHRALWDALSAEMCQGLDELGILEQEQSFDWTAAHALGS